MNLSLKPYVAAMVAVASAFGVQAAERNPRAVQELLERIGGAGASAMMNTELDASLAVDGRETFTIVSEGGKPLVKGSSLSAITTGINWYLNHTARENLTWNRLTTTFSGLPAPAVEETHTTSAEYRYYLNYCTFSYSMSTWTWERWEKEIDYMALHGINMPLQIVGLDVVWRNLLMKDYGYSKEEANSFIAGPCFQAWWGMNNLEGWGGPNPDWWYDRQEQLAKKILSRMRELGIEPVLPGFCGMVPHDFTAKTGLSAIAQGGWCGFTRPYILNPENAAFKDVAQKYYARLKELMGESEYYSMDPFHEGANTSGIVSIDNAYKAIYDAMEAARSGSKWVIQQWQWSGQQYKVLNNVPKGRLIVLDLYSDGKPNLGAYKGHDVIYNALSNFGGRTGLFGRLNGVIDGYIGNRGKVSGLKGVGATPEAIEQVPVLYDLLFELPWHASKPDAAAWLADWTVARYGTANDDATAAWEIIRNSALNCQTSLQGPHEAVMCARPAWVVNSVSTWGGANIFYKPENLIASAAYKLLDANLSGENYSFDLTDVTRQALTDYSHALLQAINSARAEGGADFAARKATFLELMADLDRLLATNAMFRLGHWTEMARGIADEVPGTTDADRDWLELNNARTLITTWGDRNQSEGGGLRDYSYRQWNGMLSDYYRPRWEKFFAGQSVNWFDMDRAFALNGNKRYSAAPEGDTRTIAAELLNKYMCRFGTDGYICRSMVNDFSTREPIVVLRGKAFAMPATGFSVTIGGEALPEVIPADYPTGDYDAVAVDAAGTVVKFTLSVRDDVTEPRTVNVVADDDTHGEVLIDTGGKEVTTVEPVKVTARPNSGFRFSHWSIDGKTVSTANPYIYYGAEPVTITAHFTEAALLVAGSLTLTYETTGDGSVIVTGVDSGHGGCWFEDTDVNVIAINADAFAGYDGLTMMWLPASCVSLNGMLMNGKYAGDGVQNRILTPESPIEAGTSWTMVLKVKTNGASFNQWGSGLLATGSDALATTYDGGIQFYLAKSGTITVKTGATEHKQLTNSVGSEFTLTSVYDADAHLLTFRLVNEEGDVQSFSVENYTMNTISQFATAIPEGVNLEALYVFPQSGGTTNAFAGCRNLRGIMVEYDNPMYSSNEFDGVLCNADGTAIVAFPEGQLFSNSFRIGLDGKCLSAAPAGDASGEITDSNRAVTPSSADDATSLWRLVANGGHCKVEHMNSHRFFGGKAGSHDRIELPVSATQWHGEYDYELTIDGLSVKMALRLADSDLYANADGELSQERVDFDLLTDCGIELPGEVNFVSLPIPVYAPDKAYIVSGLDGDRLLTTEIEHGTNIPAGTGFMVVGPTKVYGNYALIQCTHVMPGGNYLSGTLLSRSGLTAGSFFVYDAASGKFVRSATGEIPANTAYINASAFGNPIAAESLTIDVLSGNSGIAAPSVSSDKAIKYFDLHGRRASTSTGILVGSDGSKTIR